MKYSKSNPQPTKYRTAGFNASLSPLPMAGMMRYPPSACLSYAFVGEHRGTRPTTYYLIASAGTKGANA